MTDLSSLKQLVPPLSQNKAIVYFGDPIGSVEGRSGFALLGGAGLNGLFLLSLFQTQLGRRSFEGQALEVGIFGEESQPGARPGPSM